MERQEVQMQNLPEQPSSAGPEGKELKLVGEPEKGAWRKAQEWKPRAASDEAALSPEGRAPVLCMPWENEH